MHLKKGDLFNTNCQIIAHGVNCSGGFGSGVAGQIARLFPFAKTCYLAKHHGEKWHLGDIQFVECSKENKIIANCATQFYYGKNGVYVDYPAVGKCFSKLLDYAEENNLGVAMPKIGCGLAGGEWSEVCKIIQQAMQNRKVYVEVWEL